MAIYYVNQKLISLVSTFTVTDVNKNKLMVISASKNNFLIETINKLLGGIVCIPYSIYAKDNNDNIIFTLKHKFSFIWEKFDIFKGNDFIASAYQKKTLGVAHINIKTFDNTEYEIKANLMSRHYKINKNGICACDIFKKRLSVTDYYEIRTYEKDKDYFFIILAVIIDYCYHD